MHTQSLCMRGQPGGWLEACLRGRNEGGAAHKGLAVSVHLLGRHQLQHNRGQPQRDACRAGALHKGALQSPGHSETCLCTLPTRPTAGPPPAGQGCARMSPANCTQYSAERKPTKAAKSGKGQEVLSLAPMATQRPVGSHEAGHAGQPWQRTRVARTCPRTRASLPNRSTPWRSWSAWSSRAAAQHAATPTNLRMRGT